MNELHKVIIDTDTGGDDAAALILAAKSPVIKILGVTVVAGNVPLGQAAKNAIASLEAAGCDVPVCKGAAKPLDGREVPAASVYGVDGMGDVGLVHPKKTPETKSAVEYIIETVRKNAGDIEIIALGPVTNIAEAILEAPDIIPMIKRIWSMGTTGFGPGNATPVAEFNVYKDANAYKVMLDSGVPITCLGLDMDQEETAFLPEVIDKMKEGSPLQRFVALASGKLHEFMLLSGIDRVNLPDAVAMACVAWDDFVLDTAQCRGSCDVREGETYGQVIFYKKGRVYDTGADTGNANVSVVTKIRSDIFVRRFNEVLA